MLFFFFFPDYQIVITHWQAKYVSNKCRHSRVQRNSLSRYAPQWLAAGIACSQRECPGQVGSWTRSPRVCALFPLGAPVFPPQSKTHPASALEQWLSTTLNSIPSKTDWNFSFSTWNTIWSHNDLNLSDKLNSVHLSPSKYLCPTRIAEKSHLQSSAACDASHDQMWTLNV